MSWIKQHKIVSALGAFVVVVVLAAAGAGSSTNSSKTNSPALVTTSTTTAGSQASPAPAPAAAPQKFQGTGTENIGTINVPVQSTLHWTCSTCAGNNFVINNGPTDDSQISVNALGPTHGETVIDAGTYHDVSINTEGQHWMIIIRPGT